MLYVDKMLKVPSHACTVPLLCTRPCKHVTSCSQYPDCRCILLTVTDLSGQNINGHSQQPHHAPIRPLSAPRGHFAAQATKDELIVLEVKRWTCVNIATTVAQTKAQNPQYTNGRITPQSTCQFLSVCKYPSADHPESNIVPMTEPCTIDIEEDSQHLP